MLLRRLAAAALVLLLLVGSTSTAFGGELFRVNLNKATASELTLLPGVGPKRAQSIVQFRSKKKFKRLSDLMKIKGIGPKTFKQLRPFLTLEGEGLQLPPGPQPPE